MRVEIPGDQKLNGTVQLPGSKAFTHRALIAGLLSKGETPIHNRSVCDDTEATISGITALGARLSTDDRELIVTGAGGSLNPSGPIDCRESGATLRFLTAIAGIGSRSVTLNLNPGLAARPIDPLLDALRMLGARSSLEGRTLTVRGPLVGGTVELTGNVSSQFISAILFAAPFAMNEVRISIRGQLESRPYVDMTLEVLRQHRVKIERTSEGFIVPAHQEYAPAEHKVPSDYSSAAFLLAAAATVGGSITLVRLEVDEDSLEPDRLIVGLLRKMGANVREDHSTISLSNGNTGLSRFSFDAKDNPDMVPALEVLGCYANGLSRITGTGRLKFKESNRLLTIPAELSKMGGRIKVDAAGVAIEGGHRLEGAPLCSHRDHRVVMACAAAALGAKGTTIIEGADAVSKSYPQFFDDLAKLGATVNVEQ